jgi:hypothetical protein
MSVYNAEGHVRKGHIDAFSLNNMTAKSCPDGAVATHVRTMSAFGT